MPCSMDGRERRWSLTGAFIGAPRDKTPLIRETCWGRNFSSKCYTVVNLAILPLRSSSPIIHTFLNPGIQSQ